MTGTPPEFGGWITPKGYEFDNLGTCRSCGAPVAWHFTSKGNRAPLNRDGISHFATCPSADLHRKPKPPPLDGPGQARRSDPPTGKEAALLVRPGNARWALLDAHDRHRRMTDEEAAIEAGQPLTSEYATRCSELERAGYLANTDETRLGESGMSRVVRVITPAGLAILGRSPDPDPDPQGAMGL